MSDLNSISVQYLKSVGPKRAEAFNKIGINSVKDLLYYFPSKYLDRSQILNVSQVLKFVTNGYDGEITLIGKVVDSQLIQYRKKKIFKVVFIEGASTFECVWFQGISYFQNRFKTGELYAVSAKPVITRYGHLQFTHPDFDKLDSEESKDFFNTGKIIPFYSLPKELRSKNIGDTSIRKIIRNAVEQYADDLEETLPDYLILKNKLPKIPDAIRIIHSPNSEKDLENATNRFKYEELFYLEILVALRKHHLKTKVKGTKFSIDKPLLKKFLDSLPFKLTESQLKVLKEIRLDMESEQPMNRLLQGDVGSGKTVVSLIAMLIAISNGYQVSMMAPTEILATQHFETIKKLLSKFDYNIKLIIGGQKKSERENNLELIKNGSIHIVVGTHALFEENISFDKLGLVVIDEQHRFGVVQKAKLVAKGAAPDVLVTTATPIPRAITMTLYGDLDISIINEMPAERKPIITALRSDKKLDEIYLFILEKINEGYQTYIVYPLVEESEKLELKAAESYYESLKSGVFKDVKVGLLHGRMSWKDKEETMIRFAQKEFDILISTTVIEVGIDIPDANVILINDAHRFGLSQLHQLRGRVGRSNKQAYCILVSDFFKKLDPKSYRFDFGYMSRSEIERSKTKIRLSAMVQYNNGFDLAEIDFKLRGPGDIFGTKQSGFPELRWTDLTEDSELLYIAQKDSFDIIDKDAKLLNAENQLIKKHIKNTFKEKLKLSFIA
ncbi:MAG: ATP-dependent DNA helicase RecG [Melioribacteraceae bacterium]|nr:ATP-dependent DNA helicase RecG [Melioribacteraceae bacterium]